MYIFSKIIIMNYIYSYWKNNEGKRYKKVKEMKRILC